MENIIDYSPGAIGGADGSETRVLTFFIEEGRLWFDDEDGKSILSIDSEIFDFKRKRMEDE